MELNEVLKELSNYINNGTEQRFFTDFKFDYCNDYIKVLVVKTSNKHGGKLYKRGKQWGIIIDTYKIFTDLPNWIKMKNALGEDLKITKGKNEYLNKDAIRIYHMSLNPDEKILKIFFDYLFGCNN